MCVYLLAILCMINGELLHFLPCSRIKKVRSSFRSGFTFNMQKFGLFLLGHDWPPDKLTCQPFANIFSPCLVQFLVYIIYVAVLGRGRGLLPLNTPNIT